MVVVGWVPTHYKVKLQLMLRLSWAVTISRNWSLVHLSQENLGYLFQSNWSLTNISSKRIILEDYLCMVGIYCEENCKNICVIPKKLIILERKNALGKDKLCQGRMSSVVLHV